MKISLPLFRRNDKVYLHIEESACMVIITDVYRYNGINCYSVDANYYYSGLELEYVSENVLTKDINNKNYGYISRRKMNKIIEEYENT